jgi:flagellin FlaB
MSEYNQTVERNQEEGSIGIGAMIVFIALILVAAVASTIIIKTAEELQQNAESTSDDTRKEISGKISIINMIVNGSDGTDINSVIVTAKVASGSTDVLVNNIDFMVSCGDTASFGIVTGNLGTESPWGQVIAGTAGTNVKGADGNLATAGDNGAGTWSEPNAETLAGVAYEAADELTAGTVFKFDIDLDKNYLGTAAAGPCASLAGVGETLQLKMIVDGGGTTISELNIDSVVSGKAVV